MRFILRHGFGHRLLLSLGALLLTLAPSAEADQRYNVRYEKIDMGDDRRLSVAVRLPADFDKRRAYPVLLGPADGTPGGEPCFYWGREIEDYGWILVESMAFLEDDPESTTARLLDWLEQEFRVEGGKFHILGFSANSAGSFRVTLAMPERFHSSTGLPGHPRTGDPEKLRKLKGVKLQFIVGENDAYWREEAEEIHETLRALEVDSRLEVVPGGDHVVREFVGVALMKRMNALRD